jgi:hypothetical protein
VLSPRRSDEIIVYHLKFGFVAWIVLMPLADEFLAAAVL